MLRRNGSHTRHNALHHASRFRYSSYVASMCFPGSRASVVDGDVLVVVDDNVLVVVDVDVLEVLPVVDVSAVPGVASDFAAVILFLSSSSATSESAISQPSASATAAEWLELAPCLFIKMFIILV